MRIERIEMSWFRGAGRGAKLEAKAKSVAVYGANGSGKSTFADAIEYVVSGGRLGHLAHEYSGRRQVLGIRNTHAPNGEESAVHLCLEGQAQIKAVIASSGGVAMEGEPDGALAAVQEWDLRTVLLRQDEVAAFIHARKSSKYSVLLPLLGLDEMEQAAQNMHQLGRAIEKRGELDVLRERRRERRAFASECLPDTTVACAAETLRAKARQYLAEDATEQVRDLARALDAAIVERMESLDPEHKRHILFQQVQNSDLQGRLAVVIKTDWAAQEALGELLDTKIAVLEAAAEFVQAAGTDHETVECPACGDPKDHAEFTAHILAELEALDDARHARDAAARARGALARALDDVDRIAGEDVMRAWLEATEVRDCRDAVANLGTIDRRSLEDRCPSDTQALLQASIPIVGIAVEAAAAATPPPIAQLSDDKRLVEACRAVFEVQTLQARIREIEQLVDGLTTAESAVRQALRDRTTEITEEISADVQQLWAKMHPDEPIEAIQIYAPEDADKAIDIGLRFYGVDQDSPRLTLSEGHRNSLGLCIFLALAKRDDDQDRPIVLDDIVTSLDREHRGMVAEVLLDDFNHRQVIILTHDREWYTELRHRLPQKEWRFMSLKPWVRPETGLQWSSSAETFDDAKALVRRNPEAAGNCARRIMDTEISLAAERLRVPLPYLRGDRNDQRTCTDLLGRVITETDSDKRLRKREPGNGSWTVFPEPVEYWRSAHQLLLAWANRSSHTGSLTATEATQLIDACQNATARFRCQECGDFIWAADQSNRRRLQCTCGMLQWRYG